MRLVLMGDSHLARIRALRWPQQNLTNLAVGGASSRDLPDQLATATTTADDIILVSVGTNDAAPWKQVPLAEFSANLRYVLGSFAHRRWIYLAPPGVDEQRLKAHGDRTNATVALYRNAAISVMSSQNAQTIRTEHLIQRLGRDAFTEDGVHLTPSAYALLLDAVQAAASYDQFVPTREPSTPADAR